MTTDLERLTIVESWIRGQINTLGFVMDDRSIGLATRTTASVRRDALIEALHILTDFDTEETP